MLRASAFVVAFALLFTVLARAWSGELPIKFGGGGLEYTPRETTREIKAATEEALADVLDRLDALEERVPD